MRLKNHRQGRKYAPEAAGDAKSASRKESGMKRNIIIVIKNSNNNK